MRQRWTRSSRTRLVLSAVALACALSFAGQRASDATGTRAAAATPDCTVEVANRVIQPYLPAPDPDAVEEVHCGEFLGPGSQAMVATVRGDCFNYGGWAVFDLVDDAWQLVDGGYHGGEFHAVTVDATSIREERPVHRRHDWYRCSPTGGSKARSWNWDGAALSAGRWEQARPRLADGNVIDVARPGNHEEFDAARGPAIRCDMRDNRRHRRVRCQDNQSPVLSSVRMDGRGRLKICLYSENNACIEEIPEWESGPLLPRGYHVTVGRFRCKATARRAVRCTVRKTGKGFRIDNHGVHSVRRSR